MQLMSRPSKPRRDKSLNDYVIEKCDQVYEPLPLNEKSVFLLASHWFTLDEIAGTFNVDAGVINRNYHKAYVAGKTDAIVKPRMLKRDCAVLLQGFIDGFKLMVDDGASLQPSEAAEVRKVYEAMVKGDAVLAGNRTAQALEYNLGKLTDDELLEKLADAGFVKKTDVS